MHWRLADTKSRLSEVVARANSGHPQTIRRNDASVFLLAEWTYKHLIAERSQFNERLFI